MNAVEIEEAITELADQPFDPNDFPFAFLEAFGNKPPTIKRLKSVKAGSSNASDIDGGVLQRNNIHMVVCGEGDVSKTLAALKESPATTKAKAKIILATDGIDFEAEDMASGETVACDYQDFPNHFGFFLPLAGITTIKQIRNNPIDIQATSRLNRLYVELLKHNEDWSTAERRHDMNQFMARMIFCFFAEDTDIFNGEDLFTKTIEQMSDSKSENTHEVISEIFHAMDTKIEDRAASGFHRWADTFPYVNGGLFTDNIDVPRFSRIARKYLLHAGSLDWQQINPDIFGSMIQAVADDEERGSLGMHYTSVENILKLLNPLFLDDLREQLVEADDNARKLLNLRKRISNIRVFDPACGSGNFLVIAYKQMREIEFEINTRRNETHIKSKISLKSFRGIELLDFPAAIARLALIIAEYQCDVVYRGQKDALAEFLPLDAMNWIICGNALRLDWLSVCQPTGTTVKLRGDDLFSTPFDQSEIDFENEGGETYICGNPPYLGSTWQSKEQKADLEAIFKGKTKSWKSLDYVAGWFMKAAEYGTFTNAASALVSTNSICQGQQVAILWPLIFGTKHEIFFAHNSFKWANLASHNAGVTVVIVGLSNHADKDRKLYWQDAEKNDVVRSVSSINAYLVAGTNTIVHKESRPINSLTEMLRGSGPVDGGHLFLDKIDKNNLLEKYPQAEELILSYSNSEEFINGKQRYCLWIEDSKINLARSIPPIAERLDNIVKMRSQSSKVQTQELAATPHRFGEIRHKECTTSMVIPRVSSENRPYLPTGYVTSGTVIGDRNFAMYDAPLWNMALIASRLHWIWIGAVCVRLEMRFSYSNTLGWNTFPVPKLTEKNKADLARCAEDILLAREAHFPATIADLYKPETMPENLRHAHERNDEVLERIYIGRRFKNDTERLEKLFDLYTKMTSAEAQLSAKGARG
ncbi:MAG: class I SAM-dependent DNA methyltransferase [Magnetovibrio sp.]|nr:class I SAM-dependent DNA methyltransferase [Magnetovibrio sp.]